MSFEVPLVASGSVEISTSYNSEWSSGKTYRDEETFSTTKEITVPACTYIKAEMVFYKGMASLPYTVTYTYADGSIEKGSGTWRGVAVLDEYVNITVLSTNYCNSKVISLAEFPI